MSDTAPADTIYRRLGGEAFVQALARRFYGIMDINPAYGALRAMHAPDLAPVRAAFAGFLAAWLGGPRDWPEARGGFCLMSRHAGMGITAETAAQWVAAMREAMEGAVPDPALHAKLDEAFTRLAQAMVQTARAAR